MNAGRLTRSGCGGNGGKAPRSGGASSGSTTGSGSSSSLQAPPALAPPRPRARAPTLFQGTTQPRWVHTAFRPYFSIWPSLVTIR